MNLKEFATERKWKLKFLMLLIGLVVCTGSDLLVKGIVEKKLRNVPENVSGYAFEKQFLNFDTEDKIIENAYEKLEDGSYQLKDDAIVIDVGINTKNDETGKSVLCGDVNVLAVSEYASLVTAVPGGIGSVTSALLFANTLKGWYMVNNRKELRFDFEV